MKPLKTLKRILYAAALAIAVSAATVGCQNPLNSVPKPQTTNKLADNVHVLTSSQDSNISFVSGTYIIFTQSPNYSPGDVIVSDISNQTPDGLLRKVTSVAGDTVYTTQASLEDALKGTTVSFSSDATLDSSGKFVAPNRAVSTSFDVPFEKVIYDQDGNLLSKGDQIVGRGDFYLTDSLHLNLNFKKGTLEDLKFTNTSNENFVMTLTSSLNGNINANSKVTLESFSLKPFTLGFIPTFPPIPVVIFPSVDINAGLSASNISLGSGVGVSQNASLVTGLSYSNGKWSPIGNPSGGFVLNLPSDLGTNSAKVYLGPQLKFLLYNVAGPYGGIDAYLRAATSGNTLAFYGGLEASLGVQGSIFGKSLFNYSASVLNYEKLLKQIAISNSTPPTVNTTTVDIQPGPTNGKDAYIENQYWYDGTSYYAEYDDSVLRVDNTSNEESIKDYSMIQFPLNSIPSGATIESAKLKLFYNNDESSTDETIYVKKITSPWNEYNTTGNATSAILPSYSSASYSSFSLNGQGRWYDCDVTSLVNELRSGNNYGMMLIGSGSNYLNHDFYSSDYTIDPSLRPILEVTYSQ